MDAVREQVAKKQKPPARRVTAAASYHHGDLRQSLKTAALEVLAGSDSHLLSFRDIARKLGVSTGAPYFHFKDRTHLLVELAIDGFHQLQKELEGASQRSRTNEDLVRSLTTTYLNFARQQRGYYQAMFLPEVCAVENNSELRNAADGSFQLVCRTIAAMQTELSQSEISDRAVSLWSFLHGVIDLRSAGILARRLSVENENKFAVEAVHRLLEKGS